MRAAFLVLSVAAGSDMPLTQYGCGDTLTSDRATEVGTAADGYGGTVTSCRDYCRFAGFDFFGLGCPSATKTKCQCYSDDTLADQGFPIFAMTESCAKPGGECMATASVDFKGKPYSLGGANQAAIYGTWYNSRSVQHGCADGLSSDRTREVATAAEGYGSTITSCKEHCAGEGFPFFGLGCPSATKTMCQCYTQSRIDGAGLSSPETKSCANPAGKCTNTDVIMFQSTPYYLGGSNRAAVYAVDHSSSHRALAPSAFVQTFESVLHAADDSEQAKSRQQRLDYRRDIRQLIALEQVRLPEVIE